MNEDDPSIIWRTSSASGSGNCVEVGTANDMILVRDTKDRARGELRFTASEWRAFLTGVGAGEFSVEELRRT